ncbi:MAG: ribosome maturation factor RimP [Polyangiaceae bacterium]|nr:ribosome maturation factor RimP [Polyangiaceae bacterium]
MPKISTHTDPVLERVRALVAPLCVAHGVDLVDIAWFGRTMRVTIERKSTTGKEDPNGTSGWGVSLDDCADVSRDISRALDENEDVVPGSFSLEVSSPGLERELYDDADFRRFVGFLAKVKLSRPAPDGQKLLRGRIEAVSGEGAALELTMRVDNKTIVVPFQTVTAAHLVYELPTAAKSQGSGAGAAKSKKDKRRVSQKGV